MPIVRPSALKPPPLYRYYDLLTNTALFPKLLRLSNALGDLETSQYRKCTTCRPVKLFSNKYSNVSGYFDPKNMFFSILRKNDFRGDLSDVSAIKTSLL